MHKIVESWQETVRRKTEHMLPMDEFLEMINTHFKYKKAEIGESNELMFNSDGVYLEPTQLSSGEKQLLILFAESVLQKKQPWLYIADEPELSLHVSWQENLVSSISNMNPKAQLIIATHSPDIVGNFQNYVLRMEDIIQ